MQPPAERRLLKRQRYFVFMIEDMSYHAYQGAGWILVTLVT